MSWKNIFRKGKEIKSETQYVADKYKPATNATDALKNIARSLEEIDVMLDENPEMEKELMERLKNEKSSSKRSKKKTVKPSRKKSLKSRLKELKELYDDDLITEQEYERKRQNLIDSV